MKVNETGNRFKTGFPESITGLPKKLILTSLNSMFSKKWFVLPTMSTMQTKLSYSD